MFAKFGFCFDPVEHICGKERLWPYSTGVDSSGLVLVDDVLGEVLLGVAVEGHFDSGGLAFGCEVAVIGVDEFDALFVRQERAAGGVEVCSIGWRAVHIAGDCCAVGVGSVHFAAEGLELGECDVRCAAFGRGCLTSHRIVRCKGRSAFRS